MSKEQDKLLKISEQNQRQGFNVIRELKLYEIFDSFNIQANLIGSLQSGLLMKNKDIDFHIYSDPFSFENSFAAITAIAKNHKVKEITYKNLLDTEEACLEWHLQYNDEWKIDIIHILTGSHYAGMMERTTEKIKSVLTPEFKFRILSIKNNVPMGTVIPGIEIYMAVIRDGVKTYDEFMTWKSSADLSAIIEWQP